jgi:hypothetical protein
MIDHPDEKELKAHQAFVPTDHPFKRQARYRQSLWREGNGFPIGLHRGKPLGSRLKMPEAENHLWNFLTNGIRRAVRAAVCDPDKLISAPRIYDDLLSSQPMCFNLFGELALAPDLCGRVLRRMLPETDISETQVVFEYSPGRRDKKFTEDNSAFDVYIEYRTSSGAIAFLGIEVKYVEDMNDKLARYRERYDEIADMMGCFRIEERYRLKAKPISQLWRDHLLAGSMLLDKYSPFCEGRFVVLYPSQNNLVDAAVRAYSSCLNSRATFRTWTLEAFVDALDAECDAAWVSNLRERYLGA